MISIREDITVDEALHDKRDAFDLFKQIYERVRDLYSRSGTDSDCRKIAFDSIAKKENIKEIPQLKLEFLTEIENREQNENFDEYLIYFYVLITLDAAYKYCCYLDMSDPGKPQPVAMNLKLINYPLTVRTEIQHLYDMIDSLSMLEDITANHMTGEVTRHFVEKAIEKATKEARHGQSKGGKTKAEIDANRLDPAKEKLKEIWDKGNWTSKGRGKYVDFAEYITYNDMVDGVNFDFVRTYISKYDKLKF